MNLIEENIGKYRHLDNGLGCDFSGYETKSTSNKRKKKKKRKEINIKLKIFCRAKKKKKSKGNLQKGRKHFQIKYLRVYSD